MVDSSPVTLDDSPQPGTSPLEYRCDGDDAFFARLSTMLPSDVARSFSDAQLAAIAWAFGTRRWRDHTVDLRWLLPLFGRSYYFVFLAGPERRTRARLLRDRLLQPIITIGNFIVAALFFTSILISILVTLYVVKSMLGINLFANFSLGVFGIIEEEARRLFGL